jgi:hypothetical protein
LFIKNTSRQQAVTPRFVGRKAFADGTKPGLRGFVVVVVVVVA